MNNTSIITVTIKIAIVICFLTLPLDVWSQSYLKKKIIFSNNVYTANDSIALYKTVIKAKKWYRFRSKKCTGTIKYLEIFQKKYVSNSILIDDDLVNSTCNHRFSKENYKKYKHLVRDSALFQDKIRTNKFFIENVFDPIDESRFNIAVKGSTIESYFEYLKSCDLFSENELQFKNAAEDSIFKIYVPNLYVNVNYYVKINELSNYLGDNRNIGSSNYFKALKTLYLIYSNDGDFQTIKTLIKNSEFLSCKNLCTIEEQKELEKLIDYDTIQAKLYDRIIKGEVKNQDSLRQFVKNNLPKESAYRVLQIIIKPLISNYNDCFIEAAEIVKQFINEKDDSLYCIFPEMKEKLKQTISLLERSRSNRKYSCEFINKTGMGYGSIQKAFITDKSFFVAIGGQYNDVASMSKINTGNITTTVQSDDETVFDVASDDKRLSILKGTTLFIMKLPKGIEMIDYFNQKSEAIIISEYKNNSFNGLSIVNDSTNCYLVTKDTGYINNKWPQLNNSEVAFLWKEKLSLLKGMVSGRYNETDTYLVSDTLFFSSNSFYGFGGSDIFMSVYKNGNWSKPINLGFGINSSDDDLGFRQMDGQHLFITVNGNDSLNRKLFTSAVIPANKNIFYIYCKLPDKCKNSANSTIFVNLYENDSSSKPIRGSYLNTDGNSLHIKLSDRGGYINIGRISQDSIVFLEMNLKRIPLPENKLKDTLIVVPDEKNFFLSSDYKDFDKNSIEFEFNYNYKISSNNPDTLFIGNNLFKWYLTFEDNSDTVIIERNIKLIHADLMQNESYVNSTSAKIVYKTGGNNDYVKTISINKGDSLTHAVYFKTDEFAINKDGEISKLVKRTTDFLDLIYNYEANYGENLANPSFEFSYEGFADMRGDSIYNSVLSLNRAKQVASFLDSTSYCKAIHGNVKNTEVKAGGKTDRFGKNKQSIEEQWQENRRVNVKIKWNR